jgi:hemerythrin-like domain-containing protein
MSIPEHAPAIINTQRRIAWGQEMRAVHQRLRDALTIARDSVEHNREPESLVANDLQLYCGGFCMALSGHHTSEDATLFPLVLGIEPDLAETIRKLRQDHSMIAHLIRGLELAVRSGDEKVALLRHLDGIEAVMETHFGFEERQLAGLLDTADGHGLDKTAFFGPIA